jgi:hypothetical protein
VGVLLESSVQVNLCTYSITFCRFYSSPFYANHNGLQTPRFDYYFASRQEATNRFFPQLVVYGFFFLPLHPQNGLGKAIPFE